METVIAYLVALSLPLWLVVEELLHQRETATARRRVRDDHRLPLYAGFMENCLTKETQL